MVAPSFTTQFPTLAKPKVGVIVERVKLIPVASLPETVTRVGAVVEGSMVTANVAEPEASAKVASIMMGLLPPGMAAGAV